MSPIPEERERINQNESKIGVEIGEKRDEEVSKLFDPLIWFRFSYTYTQNCFGPLVWL